jgi:SIR2-like domain
MGIDMAKLTDADRDILASLLKARRLIIFAGAGVSMDAGLPSWNALIKGFIDFCEIDILPQIVKPSAQERLRKVILDVRSDTIPTGMREYSKLLPHTQSVDNPLDKASVLRDVLYELQRDTTGVNINQLFENWIAKLLTRAGNPDLKPSAMHRLIVQTDFPYIITTNYDELFEQAVEDLGMTSLKGKSFAPGDARDVALLIREKKPAIIHVHGMVRGLEIRDLVFTLEDYADVTYGSPGFKIVLQSLFVGHSILFVGYGGYDAHISDVLREIHYHLPGQENHYLMLLEDESDEIREQVNLIGLNIKIVTVNNHKDTESLLQMLQQVAPRIMPPPP